MIIFYFQQNKKACVSIMNSNLHSKIDFSIFHPLTDNNDVLYEWLDITINNGDLVDEIESGDKTYNVYEQKNDFFGLRAITDAQKEAIAFSPIFDFPKPTDAQIKGVSVLENTVDALLTMKKDTAVFSSLITNYNNIRPHLPKLLNQKVLVSFSGWIKSLEKQLAPPQIKQKDGSMVTTKGSSIFYNVEEKKPYEFVYQFKVEEHSSMLWNDFIEIIQIKTTLFKTEKEKIDLNLYATERILQNGYFPKDNDDIMGVMELYSLTM